MRGYQGREICFGANETGLSIADVTNRENPVAIARGHYPNMGYAHQGWLTEDQRYWRQSAHGRRPYRSPLLLHPREDAIVAALVG